LYCSPCLCPTAKRIGPKSFMGLIDRYKGVDKLVAAAELSLGVPVVGDPSVATEVGPQPRRDSVGFGSLTVVRKPDAG